MKKNLLASIAISAILFTACGGDAAKTNEHEGHDMTAPADTTQHGTASDEKEIKAITATFSGLDGKVSASITSIVDGYLNTKNALVADNSADASKAASAMNASIKSLDKSLLNAEQKTVYDGIEKGLKSASIAIEKQAADIAAQRAQFYGMSMGIYDLVKAFGGGRTLYHDHCPMARDNQGALWISELKDVKNPYYGADMLTCGTVEEVIN